MKYVAGGVTEGQDLPQKWLRSPREANEYVKDPEMDPKWSLLLPLTDLSPFPWPFIRSGVSTELRSQILAVSRQILTFPDPQANLVVS